MGVLFENFWIQNKFLGLICFLAVVTNVLVFLDLFINSVYLVFTLGFLFFLNVLKCLDKVLLSWLVEKINLVISESNQAAINVFQDQPLFSKEFVLLKLIKKLILVLPIKEYYQYTNTYVSHHIILDETL